jgi:hypothetical protein
LGRRAKIILVDFSDVLNRGVKLNIGGETTPELRARPSGEAEREFKLKHQDRAAEEWSMRK